MRRVILDGVPIQVRTQSDNQRQVNSNGKEERESEAITEIPPMQQGTSEITQSTELGDALKELNNAGIEPDTRMSGIDMRSNLHHVEIPAILGVDTLVAMRFLPTSCLHFTMQKKRLSASKNGAGREQIVRIVGGKKEQDASAGQMGFIDRMKKNLVG